jgi:nitrogen fixation NifU-like protein
MSTSELRDLYRELILDHARHPRHFGRLDTTSHSAQGLNPLCGDKLHLYLNIEEGIIVDAAFEGSGCAISVASASLLTDTVVGMDTRSAQQRFRDVISRMTGDGSDANDTVELGKLHALEGVREFPARVKCATLAWHALHNALDQQDTLASTE